MKTLPPTRLAAFSTVLALPALILATCGILKTAFGFDSVNQALGAFMSTSAGKVFFSPVLVLGGVLASLTLNLWAACRVRVGLDTGTVYITFWIARAPGHLIFIAVTLLLATLLLAYGFVENFSIVPR